MARCCIVVKSRYGGVYNTNLHRILKQLCITPHWRSTRHALYRCVAPPLVPAHPESAPAAGFGRYADIEILRDGSARIH